MESQEAERRIGSVLRGKWRLERLLGIGGMAAAYVGVHRIGRREAIKILHPEVARSSSVRERFQREARAVNMFKHPAVVEIRDVDVTEDGLPFLVMELVEGESLAAHVRRSGGVHLESLLHCTDQLLDALGAAHQRGIIHRDIKPSNLIVQPDGRLKVLDFGIARVEQQTPEEFRTRTGTTLGTASYMSPEQIRGGDIDGRADLFSVGATMFRLISGRRIHEAFDSEGDLLIKMATIPAPSLASVVDTAPENLCRVVDRALSLNREQRYPDAQTMRGDVQAVRRGDCPTFAMDRLAREGVRDVPTQREGPRSETASLPAAAAWEQERTLEPGLGPGAGEPIQNRDSTDLAGGEAATKPVLEDQGVLVRSMSGDDLQVAPVWSPPTRVSSQPEASAQSPAEFSAIRPVLKSHSRREQPFTKEAKRWLLLASGSGVLSFGVVLGVLWTRGMLGDGASDDALAAFAAGFAFIVPVVVLGFALLWSGWRMGRRKDPDKKAMRVVVEYARAHGGVVSPAKLAVETTLSLSEAAEVLEALARTGSCTMVSTSTGNLAYQFEGEENDPG